jgi:hypothetical protein
MMTLLRMVTVVFLCFPPFYDAIKKNNININMVTLFDDCSDKVSVK